MIAFLSPCNLKMVFILPSFFDKMNGYRIQGSKIFSLGTLPVLLYCLLASIKKRKTEKKHFYHKK